MGTRPTIVFSISHHRRFGAGEQKMKKIFQKEGKKEGTGRRKISCRKAIT